MERLGEEMLADIEKETVDMVPTFDESDVEPAVLPAKFPQLLVNGTTGIGVGMATNIPPHNLGEVIDATVHLLENPEATVDELMQFIPGPDFPTAAIIRGRWTLRQFYQTGHGSVKIRAKADIIEKR
jgi:DNA gyrase subunit A